MAREEVGGVAGESIELGVMGSGESVYFDGLIGMVKRVLQAK